jgi:hypothetical protein
MEEVGRESHPYLDAEARLAGVTIDHLQEKGC